jgi:hypothetical protein
LDAEHAGPVDDDVVDRLELVGAELRRGVPRERAQPLERGGLEAVDVGGSQAGIVSAGGDESTEVV